MNIEQGVENLRKASEPLYNALMHSAGEVVGAIRQKATEMQRPLMAAAGALAIGLILMTSGCKNAQDQIQQVPYGNRCFNVIQGDIPQSILDEACAEIEAKPVIPNCVLSKPVVTVIEDDIQGEYEKRNPDSHKQVGGFFEKNVIHVGKPSTFLGNIVEPEQETALVVHEAFHSLQVQDSCRPQKLVGIPSASGRVDAGEILTGTASNGPLPRSYDVCIKLDKPIQGVNRDYPAGETVCIPQGAIEIETALATGVITGHTNVYGTDVLFNELKNLGINIQYEDLSRIVTAGMSSDDFWEHITSELSAMAPGLSKERITQLIVNTMLKNISIEDGTNATNYTIKEGVLIYNPYSTNASDEIVRINGKVITSPTETDGKVNIKLPICPTWHLAGRLNYQDWVKLIKNPPKDTVPPALPPEEKLISVTQDQLCKEYTDRFDVK